ncbi:MAG: MBL fold metallo-hydrolase [Patescibacteria group bacterium]|jgi:ribonuclease BN (tRNA processing enzyme)
MKLTILGSGTTVPSIKRSAPAYLLEVAGKQILLDSGEGTKRRLMEAGKDPRYIDYFYYTHTHIDHVAELPALLWGFNWHDQPRTKVLEIFGPKGFKRFFKKMLAAFWPQFEEKAKYKVSITELRNKQLEIGEFTLKTRSLDKPGNTLVKNSIGYRIEHGGKSFVYTGDVGYNKDVIKLAKKADLLLIESAKPTQEMDGHLTPQEAGKLASEAKVKKVVLTHFYPVVERIDIMAEARKTFNGEIVLAEDLMEIEI